MVQHPDHFTALAILPLQDPKASVIELERAVTQGGGLRGGTLFSHINGKNLDHIDYWPLYEKAHKAFDAPRLRGDESEGLRESFI